MLQFYSWTMSSQQSTPIQPTTYTSKDARSSWFLTTSSSAQVAYIVALDNGRVLFDGGRDDFHSSGIIRKLGQTSTSDEPKLTAQRRRS